MTGSSVCASQTPTLRFTFHWLHNLRYFGHVLHETPVALAIFLCSQNDFFFFLNVLVPSQPAKFLNCATHEIFYCSLNQSRTFVGGREAHWCRWASVLPVGMCVCVSLKCTHSTTAVASGNLAAVLLLLEVSQTCCVASPKPKHILWKCGDPQRKWDKEFPRKWSASAERGNRGCAIQECSTLCTISFCVMF